MISCHKRNYSNGGGVSFSEEEWFKIQMAMKKLMLKNDCEYIRFFGKIFGIKSDYYIIQGIQKRYSMKNPLVHIESRVMRVLIGTPSG